jgi:predicted metalloprotease
MRIITRGWVVLAATLVAVGLAPGTAQAEASYALSSEPCRSLEDCYDYASMQSFYDEIIVLVDQFSAANYSAMPPPKAYYYIPGGTTLQTDCDAADAMAFFFCKPDNSIYVGQDGLWYRYTTHGDAAAASSIAHEWGHHVQYVAGVMDLVDTQEEQIRKENQADCVRGAFLRYLNDRSMLEPDDPWGIASLLSWLAEEEGPEQTHGTLQQRADATLHGIEHGLAGCNEYFPDAPLVT